MRTTAGIHKMVDLSRLKDELAAMVSRWVF